MGNGPGISFVLPMFNEKDNIKKTVDALNSIAKEITNDHEIIIVDDASTDNSVEIVKALSEDDSALKLYCLEKNTKFGGAFAKGFKQASKDVIMYMDSDMPVAIEDIKQSFPLIEKADIVTGFSKVKKGDTIKRKIVSAGYNFLVQTLFGLNVKDINSGYKIVRKSLIDDIEFVSRSPFVDVELFLHAKRKNGTVEQYPLIFRSREGGQSYIARFPVIWATFVDMIKVKIHEISYSKRG